MFRLLVVFLMGQDRHRMEVVEQDREDVRYKESAGW